MLCSALMFGNYYAYDIPAAISRPLQSYLQLDDEAFVYDLNAFYAAYSLPNTLLPLFAGVLMDSRHLHTATVTLATLTLLGQFVFGLSLVFRSRLGCIAGRFIFGLGGESLAVAQSQLTSRWFRDDGLAFALGMNLAVGRFGSVVNDFVSPYLVSSTRKESDGVILALTAGLIACMLSTLAAFFLVSFDRTQYRTLSPRRTQSPVKAPYRWNMLSKLGGPFWLLCLIMIFSYGTVIPFNTIHATLLQRRLAMDMVSSARIMAVPDTISMILTPFSGTFVDRVGHRAHILASCSLLLAWVHYALGHANEETWFMPMVPLLVLGLCYSFLLLIWSTIPLLVPSTLTGFAFGVGQSLLNVSLTVSPIIVSALMVYDTSFYSVEMFFVGCGLSSFLLSVYMMQLDRTILGGILKSGQ